MNKNLSDVVFIVQAERIHAHRQILAARSEYFRVMLFSGLAETHQREIELDVGLEPFKALLKFFYNGSISLNKDADKCGSVLDIFELARFYDIEDLAPKIDDFLTENLGIENASCILNFAVLHNLDDLREKCLGFLTGTAAEFMQHKSFKTLSKESLEVLLESNSFCPPEVDLFRAVVDWRANNLNVETESLFANMRLARMQVEDLVRVVQPTGLFSADKMFGAVSEGGLSVDPVNAINQPVKVYSTISKGVYLKLINKALVNHVRFTFSHPAKVHYVVEVSVDNLEWKRVIDYRQYPCTSLQYIYFEACKFQYMKIVADKKTKLQVHGLFLIKDMPKIVDGVVAPTDDVFTSQRELQLGASPSMVLRLQKGLNIGTIAFSQPINISSMCVFDADHKATFWISTSIDGATWSAVYPRASPGPGSFAFPPRVVSYIKICADYMADYFGGAVKIRVQCPAQSS